MYSLKAAVVSTKIKQKRRSFAGVDPENSEEHRDYLTALTTDFFDTMKSSIDQGILAHVDSCYAFICTHASLGVTLSELRKSIFFIIQL